MKSFVVVLAFAVLSFSCSALGGKGRAQRPFSESGAPEGWIVRDWSDLKNPAPRAAAWKVEDGVLRGSEPRGTWLVSEAEYGDFVLEYEFRLSERGNSGCGLRLPMRGDPAFEGLELQMVDPRYYGDALPAPDQLTGSLYAARAPAQQVYKPLEWNRVRIECAGPKVLVDLNDERILDVDLDLETTAPARGLPLRDRPRRGHIGFQELSRDGGRVEIRGVRITSRD